MNILKVGKKGVNISDLGADLSVDLELELGKE